MRVALIVSGFPTAERPNSGIFNLRSAQGLAKEHDVRVFHLRTWRPGAPFTSDALVQGLPVTSVWLPQIRQSYESHWRTSVNWALAECAGWLLIGRRLRDFDVLHSVGAAFAGVLTSHWSRRARRPHTSQAIGADVNSILPLIDGWWPIRDFQRYVGTFVANSNALADQLRRRYRSASVSVVFRGTDLSRFTPDHARRNAAGVHFLFAHGFPDYGLRWGDNQKGGRTLCEAWQLAEERLTASGATLTLAGPRSDAPEIDAWRQTLRHPSAVRLAGVVAPDAMPGVMRAHDVLIVASMEDGLPNVAVEASASGCAILGSRVGGIPEIVIDGESGLLLPPGKAADWAAALLEFAASPERVRALGAHARTVAERHFDAGRYAQSMTGVYQLARAKID